MPIDPSESQHLISPSAQSSPHPAQSTQATLELQSNFSVGVAAGKIGQSTDSAIQLNNDNRNSQINSTMSQRSDAISSESVLNKWFRSAALSSLTSSFNENPFVSQMRNQGLKPPNSFFDKQCFSRPRSLNEVKTRLELNLQTYQFNYIACCLLIAIIAILTQPSLLLTLMVLFAVGLYVLSVEVLLIGSIELRGRQKNMTFSVFALLLLFLINGSTIFTVMGMCGLLVIAHAALHNLPDSDSSLHNSNDSLV